MKKVLFIRFSSFGDVLQSLSIAGHLNAHWPDCEVHVLTRDDFSSLFLTHPSLSKVWSLKREKGFLGLLKLAAQLRKEDFTHIYDAHNNLRSFVVTSYMRLFTAVHFLRRPIYRYRRFLLFNFRINHFDQPFSGQRDLLAPLTQWNLPFDSVEKSLPPTPQFFVEPKAAIQAGQLFSEHTNMSMSKNFIALAASSAHDLKKWPVKNWIELIKMFPDHTFVLLGGPQDRFFSDIVNQSLPAKVFNFAGKLSLMESAAVVEKAKVLIANDTGLMHIAEQLGLDCIALMGPAPFGFPSRRNKTRILEVNLSCRPCSKHGQGPCTNSEFQKCMVDLTPLLVGTTLQEILTAQRDVASDVIKI